MIAEVSKENISHEVRQNDLEAATYQTNYT